MRRVGNLWPQVVDFENLHRSAYQVFRGKRDRECCGDFFLDLEGNLLRLREELASGEYRPEPYSSFWIHDPKPRLISAAPLRDRVVHHALVNVIEPVFERKFIHHSYACRKGKGTHACFVQFVHWVRQHKYVLKMDIRKFFPSIDHGVLKDRIHRSVKDPRVLDLCVRIIDHSNPQERVSMWFPGDDLLTPCTRRKGIPIGNLTSQFFGNVYLDAIDHHITDRMGFGRYLRYADDFCVFENDKSVLVDLRAAVVDFLAGQRLKLNDGKSRVRQVKEGIEFLGFVVLPDRIRVNRRGIRRMRDRVRRHRHDLATGRIQPEEVQRSLTAWEAHVARADSWRLSRMVRNSVGSI